ncbi:hypothetical protein [Mycobacteroides abscessus]|uniref:hypothetical protein n=1 Tax=Mycobacteroides abscessus TaxID=36809 RepID=UPI00232FE249|nr:hypothetical protein [Mycobacteroides abscessus]MDB2215374.1 hypothetical protein [Mycobacteroides abscessus subsp. massiliense]WJJ56498.1 immunity repressor [Mycobacterium phage prophiT49-3]
MDRTITPQLTKPIIEQLMNQGMNFTEIGNEWGMTRSGVSWIYNNYGGKTLRKMIKEVIPFKVPNKFNRAYALKRLREHAEYVIVGNVDRYTDERRNKLRSFHKKMVDEVVEYNPETGFTYRTREPRDNGLMIRVNEHTNITEYGEELWKLPTREL